MASIFRDNLFQGKNAFITGGTSGINLRIAERFSEQGARVALLGRDPAKGEAAAKGISDAGGEALSYAADVRDYGAVEEAVKGAVSTWGEIDILICGAAGNFPAPAAGMSPNAFKAVVDIDLLGTYNACRAAFAYLKKPGAAVLAITANQAFIPTPMQSHVCAAKAGVDQTIRTLAIEWGSLGIRLNGIAPGPVADTVGMERLSPTKEMEELVKAGVPLGRYATKDEIADLAIFLCSDAASYVTGAIYICDGGQSLLGSGLFMKALRG